MLTRILTVHSHSVTLTCVLIYTHAHTQSHSAMHRLMLMLTHANRLSSSVKLTLMLMFSHGHTHLVMLTNSHTQSCLCSCSHTGILLMLTRSLSHSQSKAVVLTPTLIQELRCPFHPNFRSEPATPGQSSRSLPAVLRGWMGSARGQTQGLARLSLMSAPLHRSGLMGYKAFGLR